MRGVGRPLSSRHKVAYAHRRHGTHLFCCRSRGMTRTPGWTTTGRGWGRLRATRGTQGEHTQAERLFVCLLLRRVHVQHIH